MKRRILPLLIVFILALTGCSGAPSAEELFANAQKAYNEGQFRKALDDLQTLMKKYPEDAKYPEALFLYAFINANELNDLKEAKKSYQAFLKKYPEHEMAASAKFELENLGKPVDELLLKMNIGNEKN